MLPIGEMVERVKRIAEQVFVPEDRLYACPECLDDGFTHHEVRNNGGAYQGTVAHFCESCELGLRIEAGYWVALLTPANRRFKPAPRDKRRFDERLRIHPRGLSLRDAVNEIAGRRDDDD